MPDSRVDAERGARGGHSLPPDGFPIKPTAVLYAEHVRLGEILIQAAESPKKYQALGDWRETAAGKQLVASDQAALCRAVMAIAERCRWIERQCRRKPRHDPAAGNESSLWSERESTLCELAMFLLRKQLPFCAEQVADLTGYVASRPYEWFAIRTRNGIVAAAERLATQGTLSKTIQQNLRAIRVEQDERGGAESRKTARRIDAILPSVSQAKLQLDLGDAWAAAAAEDIEKARQSRESWIKLIEHCRDATSGAPTARWRKSAEAELARIGATQFRKVFTSVAPLVDAPRQRPLHRPFGDAHALLMDDGNADVLKGLAWCCAYAPHDDLARALGVIAISAYKKVPGLGPRLARVGNACIWALSNMPGEAALAQLALLKVRVKFGTAQKLIERAFNVAAEKAGLPREEIEELAVPGYGLSEVGLRREELGEFVGELAIDGPADVELRWSRRDGKRLKSVPAAVKTEHADELKELKQALGDVQKMLPAQRERLDTLFLSRRSWPLTNWRERYLDHPLIGVLARRLIWRFESGKSATDAIHVNGALARRDGRAFEPGEDARVTLWHPMLATTGEVLAWREFIEQHQIRQPFKQAHREVYILTDAERATNAYSNRFAAHILRQHQFNALCAARGWKNKLRLMVDAEYPPATRHLPQWGLRAEFWIEGVGEDYGTDTNETGVYHRVGTDQVRFYRADVAQMTAHAGGGGYGHPAGETEDQALTLDLIPPLVFSEIMRDVDLFVGVASVGNDPTWQDGGPDGRYRDYWQGYSFGELNATAQTRRQVLERLIPRLAIAPRCSFAERFLVVRGDLRTYKIHLGSGNILMAPNDQYLCIVPKQSAEPSPSSRVYLPFEGDRTLSIILSKALMLADDKKIKDPTITQQIKR